MKHMKGAGLGASEIPIVSLDYMFMGDGCVEAVTEAKTKKSSAMRNTRSRAMMTKKPRY